MLTIQIKYLLLLDTLLLFCLNKNTDLYTIICYLILTHDQQNISLLCVGRAHTTSPGWDGEAILKNNPLNGDYWLDFWEKKSFSEFQNHKT